MKLKFSIKGMLTACLFLPITASAQSEIDALRYSQTMQGSTARSLAMGGSFGALGGDFSCLSSNPAGIGIFRKSDATISMGFNSRGYKSDYEGTSSSDDRFDVDIPNIGLVLASGNKNENAIGSGIAFAIGYNKLANFNSNLYFQGKNNDNSILDSFLDITNENNGTPGGQIFDIDPFGADLAYQTFLINPTAADSNFYSSVIPNGGAYQSMTMQTNGSIGEFSLGLAGTATNDVLWGISLGFPSINYEETSSFEENDTDNSIFLSDTTIQYRDFKSLRYDNYLQTTGNGFNMKGGIIWKPIDWVRFGIALHTPTWYAMSDIYNSKMQSKFNNGSFEYQSPEGNYSYKLVTSWKTVGSVGFVIQKKGLVSLECELLQYQKAKLRASDYNFQSENSTINTNYRSSNLNFRAGTEWRFDPFTVRAGIAYYGSPFKSNIVSKNSNQQVVAFSGGAGYRGKKYFFDLGFCTYERGELYIPYSLKNEASPIATEKRNDTRVVATFGWKF